MVTLAIRMATIGIMDSGSGGLSVLKEILTLLPREKYIYFSDNAYCPYGDKSQEEILERCRLITRNFIADGAEAVVIACNTATAAAIATLRTEFDLPFVGMEPAVKPAALGTRSGVIGVLATAGTLKASKYLHTRGQFEDEVKIVEHVGKGFVELVENLELDGPDAEEVVRASLVPLLDAGADRIVLGCTHYPFLRPVMEKVISQRNASGIKLIDPAPAVAKRLVAVLEENGISLEDSAPEVQLDSSGTTETLHKLFELIRPSKQALRARMKLLEKEFLESPESIAEAQLFWDKIEADTDFTVADTVLIYMDIPGEIPTGNFIRKWYGKKRLVIPKCVCYDGRNMLELFEYDPAKLKSGHYGVTEPTEDAIPVRPEEIDYALIPGVAFSESKGSMTGTYKRLGRGKGFYDSLMPSLKCPCIPAGFTFRFIDDIPTDSWDSTLSR